MDSPFALPQLPALPALPAFTLPNFSTGLNNLASSVASGAKKAVTDPKVLGPLSISQLVAILTGLLFILGAVLSFKDSREFVVTAGKTAAKAAI